MNREKLIHGAGWTFLSAGSVILLYVIYLVGFTELTAGAAQNDLAQEWEDSVNDGNIPAGEGDPGIDLEDPDNLHAQEPSVSLPGINDDDERADEPVEAPTSAYAAMWFERDGERIFHSNPLYVLHDVSLVTLRSGPGHYPHSAAPGGDGNFAIAGHRTTYGSPFRRLNELRGGDTIHVMDRSGTEYIYEFHESRIIPPTDTWVVEEQDPLGLDQPMLTLTTCHPLYSAAERLVVWATFQGEA